MDAIGPIEPVVSPKETGSTVPQVEILNQHVDEMFVQVDQVGFSI